MHPIGGQAFPPAKQRLQERPVQNLPPRTQSASPSPLDVSDPLQPGLPLSAAGSGQRASEPDAQTYAVQGSWRQDSVGAFRCGRDTLMPYGFAKVNFIASATLCSSGTTEAVLHYGRTHALLEEP